MTRPKVNFEYRVVRFQDTTTGRFNLESRMNECAAEGWTIKQVLNDERDVFLLFLERKQTVIARKA
jgi:hypothetical protein